ncbi:MAG: O-antigen ligase family protein [Candidatus Levybacteria bacterium]|nr:O-antigen ligase family protein [Candidatus Levybacteria bacterium]
MVLLKYLFPLLFISFALSETLKIRVYQSVAVGLFDFVIFTIVVVWFFTTRKEKYEIKKPIAIFSSIGIISLVINFTNFNIEQIFISLLYLIRWILYACIYFVIVDTSKSYKNNLMRYMFLSGVLVIVLGFIQFFFYPNLKNLYYLGFDEHMHRLFSTFLDPNYAGTFFVLFFVFIFVLRDKLFGNKKSLSYLVLVINFIAIVLTFSRGAILMFIVCVVIYSALTRKWKLTAGVICLFALIFFVLSPIFYIENTNLLRFASTEARIDSSKRALEIFQKNPMGVGFNTYRFAREKYEKTEWTGFGPSHSGAGVDNSFVLILVTTGLLGLMSYVYLLYKLFKLGFAGLKKNKISLVLIISLGGLAVNALFINSLLYSFIMIWIWILAGLTESKKRG